jgi:hypothetical protein
MTKVIGMLVALAMFCAMPAVAFAGGEVDGNQEAEIDSGAVVVGGGGDDNGDPYGNGDDNGNGDIDVSDDDRNAICQQIAGGDAHCNIDQSQNFGADRHVTHRDGHGVGVRSFGVGGGHVSGGGGGVGGGVQSVTLARTGFDAWVLALLGGLSVAGGLGLLAAQRRGRLDA